MFDSTNYPYFGQSPKPETTAQPILIAAWSVTTPAYIRYGSLPYKDTPRSKWERYSVVPGGKQVRRG